MIVHGISKKTAWRARLTEIIFFRMLDVAECLDRIVENKGYNI